MSDDSSDGVIDSRLRGDTGSGTPYRGVRSLAATPPERPYRLAQGRLVARTRAGAGQPGPARRATLHAGVAPACSHKARRSNACRERSPRTRNGRSMRESRAPAPHAGRSWPATAGSIESWPRRERSIAPVSRSSFASSASRSRVWAAATCGTSSSCSRRCRCLPPTGSLARRSARTTSRCC